MEYHERLDINYNNFCSNYQTWTSDNSSVKNIRSLLWAHRIIGLKTAAIFETARLSMMQSVVSKKNTEHDGQRKGQTSPGLRGSPQINICTNKTIAIIDLSKNGGNFNKVNRVVIFKFIH